jgi:hypothetical protein
MSRTCGTKMISKNFGCAKHFAGIKTFVPTGEAKKYSSRESGPLS